jgi:hypothetical protein
MNSISKPTKSVLENRGSDFTTKPGSGKIADAKSQKTINASIIE